MTLPIPAAVLSQHIALLGKTRAGKSSTMRVLVEHLLDDKQPVCIVDPKGDWWGLKLSATGKSAGYPIVIFGGAHADVPINHHAGAHVAELFATGNRPCLIDLKGWMVGERTRFWIDFASTLFKLTQGMRWLVVDEVHNFAPKGKIMDPDSGRALHWSNRLASEGLGMGLHMIFASQRPQKVHNDTLTSAETLIAKKVLHPSDRDAVSDWIKGCGDPALGATVLNSLAQLERPEAWVWSPEIGFGPQRIRFPMFRTYDSFRPQSVDDTKSLKGWAEVDLDEVRAKLAAVVEEDKANDPRELKAEIARLKNELSATQKRVADTADSKAIEEADRRGHSRGHADGYAHAITGITAEAKGVLVAIEQADAGLKAVRATASQLAEWAQRPPAPPSSHNFTRPKASGLQKTPSRDKPIASNGNGSDRPLGAERRPLAALASVHPAGMTEAQWAVAAGLKRSGGTWSTYVSRLKVAGRIERKQTPAGELYFATDIGLLDTGSDFEPMPVPGHELVAFWASRIPAVAPMLRRLAELYPTWWSREDLARDLSLAASGGTFNTYLSRLRSPGLIEEDDEKRVRAAQALME